MNKKASETVIVNDNEFKFFFYTEYDFPANYNPKDFDGWDGILDVSYSVPDGVRMSPSQAEQILEDAKDELYKHALQIKQDHPNVYGNFEIENNFQNRGTWSVNYPPNYIASKVKARFILYTPNR